MNGSPKTRKRVLSGMRPTGKLHLGNYVGALQNWVGMQDQYECFFCVVDWHALTTDYADTSHVKENSLEVAFDWLAAGLDPEKSVLFLQSHVPAHAELHLLLSMITPLGWLERVPTYKEQRENIKDKDLGTYGFLGYPLLQAADILVYRADVVPVGEDQVAHIELTREIARRFNGFYSQPVVWDSNRLTQEQRDVLIGMGKTIAPDTDHVIYPQPVFPEPQSLLTPAAKLPGTDGRKMSKSYRNTIMLADPEPVVREKLRTMVNDPQRVRRTDPGNPDVCPVGDLHKIFSDPITLSDVEVGCRSAGISCLECKEWAANSLMSLLRPIQERRRKFVDDPRGTWGILEDGAAKARVAAEEVMRDVREAMHISPKYASMRHDLKRASLTEATLSLFVDSSVWTLPSSERGGAIRKAWLTHLPTDVVLRDIGSRTYVTPRGKRVGLTTAREKTENEWIFKPRARSYDVLVPLCLTKTLEIIDLVLPQKVLSPNWKKFQREDDKVVLLILRRKDDFFLAIPGEPSIKITDFRSKLKPLY